MRYIVQNGSEWCIMLTDACQDMSQFWESGGYESTVYIYFASSYLTLYSVVSPAHTVMRIGGRVRAVVGKSCFKVELMFLG